MKKVAILALLRVRKKKEFLFALLRVRKKGTPRCVSPRIGIQNKTCCVETRNMASQHGSSTNNSYENLLFIVALF
jgi:hypothetical protein